MAPSYSGPQRRAAHYGIAHNEDIAQMGKWVKEISEPDAFLALWCPHALVLDGTARHIALSWGFVPKQEIIWRKMTLDNSRVRIGGGHYARVATEPIVLCARGGPASLVLARNIPNTFDAPRGAHSAKPDESYTYIESLLPGPYVELFARRKFSEKWDAWGNQLTG